MERVAPLPTALGGTPSSAAASSGSTKKKNKPNWARIRVVRPLSIAQHDVAMLTGILSQMALRVLPRKRNGDFYIPSDFNKGSHPDPEGGSKLRCLFDICIGLVMLEHAAASKRTTTTPLATVASMRAWLGK